MNPTERAPTPGDEHIIRPAAEGEQTDWRRIEVASRRFGDFVTGGIAYAVETHSGIEKSTARTIAHVLGRGIGRMSALVDFGRTGEGDYERLRDEYLTLYHDPAAPAWAKDQINWLGTHLIRHAHPNAQTIQSPEPYPLTLDKLLVPTIVEVGDWAFTVHVPGSYSGEVIQNDLVPTLAELQIDEDRALRAFLSLPNVNVMSGAIMEDFHDCFVRSYRSLNDALHETCEVDERKRDVIDYADQKRMVIETMSPDYRELREEAGEGYDFVEDEEWVHVFTK